MKTEMNNEMNTEMNKEMKTEIIAVGTELLLGQIMDTNTQWISQQLALIGANTFYHTVVGDNIGRLHAVFQKAQERSNVIIVTGGLGPTEDDVSREAFYEMTHIPIVEEPNAMKKIEQFYMEQKAVMTPNNRRQARVFKDSIVLENKTGMAPGMIVDFKGSKWIFLPGVPREMKQLFTDNVIPFLKNRNGEMIIQSTVLKFIGIGESKLEDELKELIDRQDNPTIAPLAQKDGVTVRLTAKAKTKDEAETLLNKTKENIMDKVGQFCYGENDETIEEKIASLLIDLKKTVAAAESLTGGSFTEKLVGVNGASSFIKGGIVSYDTAVKKNVLGVPGEIINRHGTVSEECALEMAKRVCDILDTSIGVSFTGVAGPNETEHTKVGTVYIGIYDVNGYVRIEKCFFHGDRNQIRYRAVLKGCELLYTYLNSIL